MVSPISSFLLSPLASSDKSASGAPVLMVSPQPGFLKESAAVSSWIASMRFVLPAALGPANTVRLRSGLSEKLS